MEKYILILGAGLMQRPAMEAARELGYKTLVVDANPSAICVPFADRFELVDLKDREGIANLALSLKDQLAAIFTAGTDFSASVSYAAEKCALPSHSFEAACNASNKVRMRECFKKHNVPSPDFISVTENDIQSIEQKIDSFTFPKVVKPVDNMGARGCRLVRTKEEFIPALRDAVKFSRTKNAIVEDYMKGREYSLDALVVDGKIILTGFADRHIYFEPYFVELGHTMPSECSAKEKQEITDVFQQAVTALGLTNGVAKGDIKYTEKGAMIGEVAARLSGGYMSGWTFPYSSDFNLTKEAMKISLGITPEYKDKAEIPSVKFSHERAFISIPGVVKKIYGAEGITGCPFVKNVFFRTKIGDKVDFPRNNVEKCGNVITCSENRELSLNAAEKAVSSIILRLEGNNKATEDFLNGIEEPVEKGFPYSFFTLDAQTFEKFNIEIEKSECCEIPPCLKDKAEVLKDWNYRSIKETVELYKKYAPQNVKLTGKEFWRALIRGGIQGVLYVADSRSHA